MTEKTKTTQCFEVLLKFSDQNYNFAFNALTHLCEFSDIILQSFISEVAEVYKKETGDKPAHILVMLMNGSRVVESKGYDLNWLGDHFFQLINERVVFDGELINLSADIEESIKKEAREGKEKELLKQIDVALATHNKDEFMELTTQLKELQGAGMYE